MSSLFSYNQSKLFNGIYSGKKVLITGHTGFKGSWLAFWLMQMGAEVCGYALEPPTKPNHFDLLKLEMESHIGDIRDLENMKRKLASFKPEIVFHLAAQPLVRFSYKEPLATLETNIIGTANVLEACRQTTSVKAVINVTSDKCYENREWIWGYRENDPMGGYDPYSASKGCAEIVTSCYRNSYFNLDKYKKEHDVLLASCRAGNVIGGGDWAEDRLIPDIMKAASKNETVIIRNPRATRPWQHVLEPLNGYLLVGQKLMEEQKEFADSWNFGPSDYQVLSVEEVITQMQKYWDNIKFKVEEYHNAPHEANLLKLDCSKAHTKLKWKPVWSNEQTFEKTVNWYMSYYNDASLNTENNLRCFMN